MTIEVALLISVVSVAYGLYSGITNSKRNEKKDAETEATAMTTVIVKLENIGLGITEIKANLLNVEKDLKENRERLIRCEESTRQAHKRIDSLEKFKKLGDDDE